MFRTKQPCRAAIVVVLLSACSVSALPQAKAERARRQAPERADVAKFRARVEKILTSEVAVPAASQPQVVQIPPERNRNAATPAKGHWGVLVVDAATGEVLYQHNADAYFTPASNTKLFTTALGLAKLGPEYRYRTTIESRATVDTYGRLAGDVVLVARGDPNLSNRRFPYTKEEERDGPPEKVLAALADQVVARGVKQIEGNIVADDSHFSAERYPTGWAIEDMTEGYGAPVSALAVNDNLLFVEVRPGATEGELAWFGVEPWAEFYRFSNQVTTVAAADRPGRVDIERQPGSHEVRLAGRAPIGVPPLKQTLAIEEPAAFAAVLLKRLLELRGVRVYGRAVADHNPVKTMEARHVLAEHVSVPLAESVKLINKVSQNLHTEMLLRAATRESAPAQTLRDSLRAAQEFRDSIGIGAEDAVIFDGSGLSRRNLVTPRAVVTLLRWAAQQPWAALYADSLPIAGQDGTLGERMKDTSAVGRIQAKTGTLGNVNALGGYAETVHGAKLIFSMFGNHHNLRRGARVLDEICVAMVEELGAKPPKGKRR
jgi:D-alanyl-D-alanine carboxypeptidase/D-alanyl-D-alanine-endopeptidase (penicillin-binding protein 4)